MIFMKFSLVINTGNMILFTFIYMHINSYEDLSHTCMEICYR
jgi:hypothetical protein